MADLAEIEGFDDGGLIPTSMKGLFVQDPTLQAQKDFEKANEALLKLEEEWDAHESASDDAPTVRPDKPRPGEEDYLYLLFDRYARGADGTKFTQFSSPAAVRGSGKIVWCRKASNAILQALKADEDPFGETP